MEWTEGMACQVVEHHDLTQEPKAGGKSLSGVVEFAGPVYVQVRLETGQRRGFWRETGWAAWDGDFRWRLMPAEDAATAAGGGEQ